MSECKNEVLKNKNVFVARFSLLYLLVNGSRRNLDLLIFRYKYIVF